MSTTFEAFDLTVQSGKSFDEAVTAVEESATANGFRVLHIHDVAQTLREKGFEREPIKIVEVCNAKYASQVLAEDIKVGLFLPCPITVYTENGSTHISTMLPTVMKGFFASPKIAEIAAEVEGIVTKIVNDAR